MKLANSPVTVSFGDSEGPDWKANSPIPTAHDEDADSEDASHEEIDYVKSILGFDPSELFKDK